MNTTRRLDNGLEKAPADRFAACNVIRPEKVAEARRKLDSNALDVPGRFEPSMDRAMEEARGAQMACNDPDGLE